MNQQQDFELRRLFDAYTSPHAQTLALVLGEIQKDGYPPTHTDWQEFVQDVMHAMDMHDAGRFPDEWFADHQEENEAG